MSYGFSINGTDLKTQYGLILLDDLTISAPALKETRLDIPGRSGTLNASYVLTGGPVFSDRQISGTLYKGVDLTALSALRATLMQAYHGRECRFIFPDDTSREWTGVIQFGDLSASFKIPFSINVEPYKVSTTATTVTKSLTTTAQTFMLENDAMPVVPTVANDAETKITIGTTVYTIAAGAARLVPDLQIPSGGMTVSAETTSGTGTLTISYKKGAF